MRQLTVTDAKREAAKARIALSGPPGSGKTWTALRIARVLSPDGTVLFLDTEHESAKLYAPPFTFKHAGWEPPFDAKELTQAIYHYAAHTDVLIVDSLSHFWIGEGGVLEVAGGKFTGWKEARPIQRAMVEAIVRAPCHFIGCMRSKVEFTQEYDERQKKQVVTRLGTADMQSDDMPYEFTVAAELDAQHRLTITKTRCADLDGKVYQPHREVDMAATLLAWLNTGAQPASPPGPNEQEASPTEADRSRTGGHNQGKPGTDQAAPDANGAIAPSEGPPPPGRPSEGTNPGQGLAGQPKASEPPPSSPVTEWALAHGVILSRVLAHLRREHRDHYGQLRSVDDLYALQGEDAERAVAYLKAAFEEKEAAK